MGDASGDWFFAIVAALFGSYDPVIGRRMIQELFLLVPKKNGKSSYAAAIMVVAMIMNVRPKAEFLLVAPTKQIADIAYKQAANTIAIDKRLDAIFRQQGHIRTITDLRTGATLAIRAADTEVITGGKQLGTLIDETHVFAEKHNARDVFVEVRGALAARPDGFLIQITTQSKKPPSGVFKEELQNARDVRDGKLRLPLLPVLYELPPDLLVDDGWKNEETWPLVNPNLGRSVQISFLRNELRKLENEPDPGKQAIIASQHFNVQIGISTRFDRWTAADYWLERGNKDLTLESLIARSEVAVCGIDGGGDDDLLALAVLGRERETRKWLFWGKCWAHEIVLERRKKIIPELEDFAKPSGRGGPTQLTVIQEPGADIDELVEIVMQVEDAGLLPTEDVAAIGVDTMGIGQIVDALDEAGLDTDRIEGIPQGWRLTGAIKTVGRKLFDGTFEHASQPIAAWNIGNAKAVPKGNAIDINKQVSGQSKIDLLAALLDAAVLMTKNPDAAGSVFDDIGRAGQAPVEEDDIDEEILNNPGHPDWAKMKERWERKHMTVEDEDEGAGWNL